MLIYTKSKYLVTLANYMQIALNDDAGFILIDSDTFAQAVYVSTKYDQEELQGCFGVANTILRDALPHMLRAFAYLPRLLNFDPPKEVEALIGCVDIILRNKFFHQIMELPDDEFNLLKFEKYILHEYQIPWKLTLDTLIPADDYGKPKDTLDSKYFFLSIYPSMMQGGGAPMMPAPGYVSAPIPSNEEYNEYLSDPNWVYAGVGMFHNKERGTLVDLDNYDDVIEAKIQARLAELGRAGEGKSSSPAPAVEEEAVPTGVPAPDENAQEVAKTFTDMFKELGGGQS